MAQTKRKRQTKHRGNAAGVVEARGRTGRKPTDAEKSLTAKASAEKKARSRAKVRPEAPPTWRGASIRAVFAAVLMLAMLLIFNLTKPLAALELFPIVILLYIPVSFYSDRWLYARRQRRKGRPGGGPRAAGR